MNRGVSEDLIEKRDISSLANDSVHEDGKTSRRGILRRSRIIFMGLLLCVLITPFFQESLLPRVDSSDLDQVKVLSHSSYLRYEEYVELHSGERFEGKMLHVVGEMQNQGGENVKEVRVKPLFYDKDGVLIETGPVKTSIDPLKILSPNQRSPFQLILLDPEASERITRYDLSVEFTPTIEKAYGLEVVNHKPTVDTLYTVYGEVVNVNDTSVTSVTLLATFYDETGRVICVDRIWTEIDTFQPGERSPFKISNRDRTKITEDIKGYEICAQGRVAIEIPYKELQILRSNSTISDRDHYVVSGEAKNTGEQNTSSLSIIVTFYDEDGKVVTYASGLTDPVSVATGETASFQVSQFDSDLTPIISDYFIIPQVKYTTGADSTITCEVIDPSHPSYGMPKVIFGYSMTVSGTITPPRSDVEVIVTYGKPDGTVIRRNVNSNATGGYIDVFTPDELGSWRVIAAWPGDRDYKGAYMYDIGESFLVEEKPPDVEPPTVSDSEIVPPTEMAGAIFTVTVNVTDPSGIKQVTAHLIHGEEEIASFQMFDDGEHADKTAQDGIYGNTWNSTNAPSGNYSLNIEAVDILDNSEEHLDLADFTILTPPPPDFSITLVTKSGVAMQGRTENVSITVTSINNYNDTISLSIFQEPQGITIKLTPQKATPNYTSTMEIVVEDRVEPGNYTLTILGQGPDKIVHTTTYELTVEPAPIDEGPGIAMEYLYLVIILALIITIIVILRVKSKT